jgi:hypothetical protein
VELCGRLFHLAFCGVQNTLTNKAKVFLFQNSLYHYRATLDLNVLTFHAFLNLFSLSRLVYLLYYSLCTWAAPFAFLMIFQLLIK